MCFFLIQKNGQCYQKTYNVIALIIFKQKIIFDQSEANKIRYNCNDFQTENFEYKGFQLRPCKTGNFLLTLIKMIMRL